MLSHRNQEHHASYEDKNKVDYQSSIMRGCILELYTLLLFSFPINQINFNYY